ncbi:MAG: rhodanese-like domain-containing protein [Fimbriimonadaceae bacterium]|nr:rhodanese-like domain-containing protein [Fimbriimonadaceae bacterium]
MSTQRVTVSELQNWMSSGKAVQLVDVRGAGEYAAGHIPGTYFMPLEEVVNRVEDLDQHRTVVLVCQSGRRACIAENQLQGNHDQIFVLEGGTQAWADAGNPLVKSAKSTWALERQVRLVAGILVLIGVALGFTVSPGWFGIAAFVGAGLTFAGLTNICGMAAVLAKMPWNQTAKPKEVQA